MEETGSLGRTERWSKETERRWSDETKREGKGMEK